MHAKLRRMRSAHRSRRRREGFARADESVFFCGAQSLSSVLAGLFPARSSPAGLSPRRSTPLAAVLVLLHAATDDTPTCTFGPQMAASLAILCRVLPLQCSLFTLLGGEATVADKVFTRLLADRVDISPSRSEAARRKPGDDILMPPKSIDAPLQSPAFHAVDLLLQDLDAAARCPPGGTRVPIVFELLGLAEARSRDGPPPPPGAPVMLQALLLAAVPLPGCRSRCMLAETALRLLWQASRHPRMGLPFLKFARTQHMLPSLLAPLRTHLDLLWHEVTTLPHAGSAEFVYSASFTAHVHAVAYVLKLSAVELSACRPRASPGTPARGGGSTSLSCTMNGLWRTSCLRATTARDSCLALPSKC